MGKYVREYVEYWKILDKRVSQLLTKLTRAPACKLIHVIKQILPYLNKQMANMIRQNLNSPQYRKIRVKNSVFFVNDDLSVQSGSTARIIILLFSSSK